MTSIPLIPSSWLRSPPLKTCLTLLLVFCVLMPSEVISAPSYSSGESAKRNGRRYTRARYRVGYMFGKRSSSVETTSKLFEVISRRSVPISELKEAIRRDQDIANEVLILLDKDDDGYLTMADIL